MFLKDQEFEQGFKGVVVCGALKNWCLWEWVHYEQKREEKSHGLYGEQQIHQSDCILIYKKKRECTMVFKNKSEVVGKLSEP